MLLVELQLRFLLCRIAHLGIDLPQLAFRCINANACMAHLYTVTTDVSNTPRDQERLEWIARLCDLTCLCLSHTHTRYSNDLTEMF